MIPIPAIIEKLKEKASLSKKKNDLNAPMDYVASDSLPYYAFYLAVGN